MAKSSNPVDLDAVIDVFREVLQQVRLAGLGAVAKLQQQGSELLQSLIREGEKVEARLKEGTPLGPAAKAASAKLKVSPETLENLEDIFQQRVARVLLKMDVPTQEDMERLNQEMDALQQTLRTLLKQ